MGQKLSGTLHEDLITLHCCRPTLNCHNVVKKKQRFHARYIRILLAKSVCYLHYVCSFVLSLLMYQVGAHWTDFSEI